MDEHRARVLLQAERSRVQALLDGLSRAEESDREAAAETGDMSDPAEPLTGQQGDDAVAASLEERLAAIERAEHRLDEGTYGSSIRSGLPIPEERLEADPAAELTVEEAEEDAAPSSIGSP
jgi:DnaK suppressor protein